MACSPMRGSGFRGDPPSPSTALGCSPAGIQPSQSTRPGVARGSAAPRLTGRHSTTRTPATVAGRHWRRGPPTPPPAPAATESHCDAAWCAAVRAEGRGKQRWGGERGWWWDSPGCGRESWGPNEELHVCNTGAPCGDSPGADALGQPQPYADEPLCVLAWRPARAHGVEPLVCAHTAPTAACSKVVPKQPRRVTFSATRAPCSVAWYTHAWAPYPMGLCWHRVCGQEGRQTGNGGWAPRVTAHHALARPPRARFSRNQGSVWANATVGPAGLAPFASPSRCHTHAN